MSTTKIKTSCPSCSKSFDVPVEYLGKRATCASCKTKFLVAAMEPPVSTSVDDYSLQADPALPDWISSPVLMATPSPTVPPKSVEPQLKPIQLTPPPAPSQPKAIQEKQAVKPKLWVPIVVGACSLIFGYFAGREHMKYQIRSTMQQALQSAFPGLAPKPAAANPVSPITKAAAPVDVPPLAIGQQYQKPGLALALTKATIAKAKLKTTLGKSTVETDDDYLVMSFTFSNTEDRKQRAFHDGGSTFSSSQLRLKDDVGNVIRGMDFGFSSKVVGALESYHDIAPGESVEHIKVFSLPLPKTKHIVLTINLECLGDDGEVSYMIPIESIARR